MDDSDFLRQILEELHNRIETLENLVSELQTDTDRLRDNYYDLRVEIRNVEYQIENEK